MECHKNKNPCKPLTYKDLRKWAILDLNLWLPAFRKNPPLISTYYVEAYKWLILAHKNGEDTSEAKLLLQNILSPNEVTEAENLAKAFVEHKSATPFTSDTIEGFYKGAKSLR